MLNTDLACARAARQFAYGKAAPSTEKLLAATETLHDHGVFALFSYCEKKQPTIAEACVEMLNQQGFQLAPAATATTEIAEKVSTSLSQTFAAQRLLIRFLDYAYIHARARERAQAEVQAEAEARRAAALDLLPTDPGIAP